MHAVIDSLHHQIHREVKGVSKRHQIILAQSGDMPVKHHLQPQDTSQAKPLYPSHYLMLQSAPSKKAELRLYHSTLINLRNYQSSYQNLKVKVGWRQARIASYWVEIHKKFSIPLACFIFVLIGAPIGMYTKNGNIGVAALIGTGFLTFYWLSLIQGENLADRQVILPYVSMWGPDIVLLVIGLVMTLHLCTSFKFSKLWEFLRND